MRPPKNKVFPPLKRGGYTARFRFMDEARGERFFDTEFSISVHPASVPRPPQSNQFYVDCEVDYQGRINYSAPASATLASALTTGTRVLVYPRIHNMRGIREGIPHSIKVVAVEVLPPLARSVPRTLITFEVV